MEIFLFFFLHTEKNISQNIFNFWHMKFDLVMLEDQLAIQTILSQQNPT